MKKISLLFLTLFIGIKTFAQDIKVDLDGKDTPAIFEKPIFWIGVAIVIIIVALILRKK